MLRGLGLRAPAAPPQPPATVQWHGVHLDPKVLGTFAAAGLIAIVVIAAWRALPKWLLVIFVLGIMAAAGFVAINLGGTHVDSGGVHR